MFEGGRALVHRAGIIRGAVFIGGFREHELFLRLRKSPRDFPATIFATAGASFVGATSIKAFLSIIPWRASALELAVLLTARDVLGDREIVHLESTVPRRRGYSNCPRISIRTLPEHGLAADDHQLEFAGDASFTGIRG